MVGTAVGSVSFSPMRATPVYGVDSFSEYSPFAVSRTATIAAPNPVSQLAPFPRSSTREEDEELFRDLFANENDWETQEYRSPAPGQKKMKPQHPVWSKGVKIAPRTDTKSSQPTLSAPVPRLNLAELMTARPDAFDPSDTAWNLGKLGSVTESFESDDDADDAGDGPETHSRKLRIPPIPPLNGKKAAVLQQETLSFLERLDLKTLLNTPRPDVLNFYPPTTSIGSAPIGSARVEEDLPSSRALNNNNKQPSENYSTKGSNEPPMVDPALARLAFIETTYGTSLAEPRKARKETFDRLANPIAGYSATLLALSPEQRRKREALETTKSDVFKTRLSPAAMKSKAPKTSSLLEHLGRSVSIYEAVANASSSARKLVKPEKPKVQSLSNNQLDAMHEKSASGRKARDASSSSRKAGTTYRKQPMKQPRMNYQVASAREGAGKNLKNQADGNNCTTFLTQPEEPEADAPREKQRLVPCRPSGPPKIPKAIASADTSTRQRPTRRLSLSSTNQQTATTSLPLVQLKLRRRVPELATKSRAESIRGRTSRSESTSKAAAASTTRARAPNRPPGGSNRVLPPSRPSRPSARQSGSQPPPPSAKTPDASSARRRPNVQPRTPKQKSALSSSAMLLMGTAATSAAPSPHGRVASRGQITRQTQELSTHRHAAKRNSVSSTPQKRIGRN